MPIFLYVLLNLKKLAANYTKNSEKHLRIKKNPRKLKTS